MVDWCLTAYKQFWIDCNTLICVNGDWAMVGPYHHIFGEVYMIHGDRQRIAINPEILRKRAILTSFNFGFAWSYKARRFCKCKRLGPKST